MFSEILFFSSTLFFIFLPILLYLIYRYSRKIEESFLSKNEDEKQFGRINNVFHFIYRLTVLSGIVFALIQIFSVIIFNNNLIYVNNLVHLNFWYFIYFILQIVFAAVISILLIFSFLYFRFRPDYRHHFLQRILKILAAISLLEGILSFLLYMNLIDGLILPVLFGNYVNQFQVVIFDLNWKTYLPAIFMAIIFTFVFRKFSRKRTPASSRIYLFIYLILLLFVTVFTINFSLKYFDLFSFSLQKLKIFHFSTAYSGIFWLYLVCLSFCSIIFSIFIFQKRDKFIGSQFAVSYTIKLAHINFYSTQILLILALLPWILLEFYKYF